MTHPTMILSHHGTRMKSLVPVGPDCQDGLVLQHFTERGLGEIALDAAELTALLRHLPTALLVQVLVERGVLMTVDLDPARPEDSDPVQYVPVRDRPRIGVRGRPLPGHVCACEAHPSLHVADAGCQRGEG